MKNANDQCNDNNNATTMNKNSPEDNRLSVPPKSRKSYHRFTFYPQ